MQRRTHAAMSQPETADRSPAQAAEPTDAEIVAAARALWRFDLCGLLLESGEHVLCDDMRVPARQRRSRCLCRDKSRAMLRAAGAKRPPPAVAAASVAQAVLDEAPPPIGAEPAAAPAVEAEPPAVPQAPSVVPARSETPPELTGWQPITQPPPRRDDDGKRVLYLLYDPALGVTPGYWVPDPWGGGDWFGTSASLDKLQPTHWMPLPDAP